MGAVERRISAWVDLVGDLLTRPMADYPHREIAAHLHESNACQVSWNWMEPPGVVGFELHVPMSDWPPEELRADLVDALLHHPVMRWFLSTGDLAPISIGRVPRAVCSARGDQVVQDHLVPIGMEQQLIIPYRFADNEHRAFVLARGQEDFSNEDVRVAAAAQPLLELLDRQVLACGGLGSADAHGLTGRELAVLRLLARGHTAATIGARLSVSERTVHRHLQGAYRKLGVHDRLMAVLVARESGLLAEAQPVLRPSDPNSAREGPSGVVVVPRHRALEHDEAEEQRRQQHQHRQPQ